MHCDKNSANKCNTKIKNVNWFLTDGSDPVKELNKTIEAFTLADQKEAIKYRCRYPARYAWLKSRLKSRLPNIGLCKELSEWLAGINADSLSLIFPASFLNNPASAFGHTLLRINPKKNSNENPLLAYAINFAADTRGDTTFKFMYRGVFGGYFGYFSVAPFYDQVTKYSEMENRDIWEFKLDLTKEEVFKIVLHVYELIGAQFPYYYFDNNCSYYLLSLIELVRPELSLQSAFPAWVIPVDTIRLLNEAGLIKPDPTFRPSIATKVKELAAKASPPVIELAKSFSLINKKLPLSYFTSLPKHDQLSTLDLASEYLSYLKSDTTKSETLFRARAWELLSLRSKLGSAETFKVNKVYRPLGHKTSRLSLGAGRAKNWFQEISLRPSYHEQLDPLSGHLIGSQMSFFDTVVRHTENFNDLSLNRLTIFDIESFSPRDRLFNDLSWAARLSYDQEPIDSNSNSQLVSQMISFGATKSFSKASIIYFLLSGELQVGEDLNRKFALGFGPKVGLVSHVSDSLSIEANLLQNQFILGDPHMRLRGEFATRVSLAKDISARFWLNMDRNLGKAVSSTGINIDFYFSPMSHPK